MSSAVLSAVQARMDSLREEFSPMKRALFNAEVSYRLQGGCHDSLTAIIGQETYITAIPAELSTSKDVLVYMREVAVASGAECVMTSWTNRVGSGGGRGGQSVLEAYHTTTDTLNEAYATILDDENRVLGDWQFRSTKLSPVKMSFRGYVVVFQECTGRRARAVYRKTIKVFDRYDIPAIKKWLKGQGSIGTLVIPMMSEQFCMKHEE